MSLQDITTRIRKTPTQALAWVFMENRKSNENDRMHFVMTNQLIKLEKFIEDFPNRCVQTGTQRPI